MSLADNVNLFILFMTFIVSIKNICRYQFIFSLQAYVNVVNIYYYNLNIYLITIALYLCTCANINNLVNNCNFINI